ncbi:MAG: HAD-IB family hydrolase [Polaromonas sp.]|uniref:HAD-IB family hydrolase n=1 Tax=Polaromonas sp. TaxID=1869339 RepID=UPI0017ACCA30|nr:HAD-IB family hydrolase [Polaromonas sp.]MBA3593241.1 HAD-IB family hydrolase [Polaromonas sp.]
MPEVAASPAADAAPVEVAAFDFDATLTRRDTLLPYLLRGLGWPRFVWALLLSGPWLAAFALRLMSNHRAKARLLRVALGGRTEAEIARWTDTFVRDYLPAQWQPDMLARLRRHQDLGHCCVIVSASPGIYLHEGGRVLGMDGVLCTELASLDGALTGEMATPNCHGQEKVRRLQAWLAHRCLKKAVVLHAYGDSSGDVPLLNLADYGYYQGQPWVRKPTAHRAAPRA